MRIQEASSGVPLISVIIVSWNVRDELDKCLHAVLSPEVSGGIDIEIIVVDNASHDGSAELATAFGDVRVIQTGSNLGYGRANNIGMAASCAPLMLILNPDVVLCPGSLDALLSYAQLNARAGIVAPSLINPDGTYQAAAFYFPTLVAAAIELFPLPEFVPGRLRLKLMHSRLNSRHFIEQRANEPFRIDFPLGACMLLSKSAYEQCGGFDPHIFMYAEEIDLAFRYSSRGWEAWQVPRATAVHTGGASTGKAPVKMRAELWKSRLYIYRKHYGSATALVLRVLLVLGQIYALSQLATRRLFGRVSREEGRHGVAIVRALIRVALSR